MLQPAPVSVRRPQFGTTPLRVCRRLHTTGRRRLAFGSGCAAGSPAIPALQETPVKGYRAFRRMHAANEKFNQEGWLECWTDLDEHGFRYDIVSERGSDYIRERVLKTLLLREQELIAAGSAGRADISDANYEFTDGAAAQDPSSGERTVLLKPKRKDVLLVNGRMVINESGTELLRVEGRLLEEPVLLDQCRRHRARVRPPRRRARADLDRYGRQAEVRRHVADGRPVSLRNDQRPPGQPGGPAGSPERVDALSAGASPQAHPRVVIGDQESDSGLRTQTAAPDLKVGPPTWVTPAEIGSPDPESPVPCTASYASR